MFGGGVAWSLIKELYFIYCKANGYKKNNISLTYRWTTNGCIIFLPSIICQTKNSQRNQIFLFFPLYSDWPTPFFYLHALFIGLSDKGQIGIEFNPIYLVFCVIYHLFWTFWCVFSWCSWCSSKIIKEWTKDSKKEQKEPRFGYVQGHAAAWQGSMP